MKNRNYYLLPLLFLLLSGKVWSQVIPDPEVLYYKFDETGTSVTNFAINPPVGTETATLIGATTQGGTGQCNGAIIGTETSSATDYLNTNWAPTFNSATPWSLSFWSSNITPSSTLFYIFGDVNSGSFRCFTNGVAGPNNWILRGAFADVLVSGGATVAPTLTTFVYDPVTSDIKAYLNGVLVNTVPQTTVDIAGTGPFKVNGYSSNTGLPMGGLMDEFRIYDRAITPAEIMQLYIRETTATLSINACGDYTSPSGNYNWNLDGSYQDTIPNSYCGDSVLTINLTINQPTTSSISPVSCESYTSPSGNAVWMSSGIYYDTIPNALGCDSLITIALTINQSSSNLLNEIACDSYTSPSGMYNWTSSGTYNDTIANANGCDSTLTIQLTISTIDLNVSVSGTTLTSATSGATSYQWIDCNTQDSIPGATNSSYTATVNGSYAVIIENGQCSATSACSTISSAEINEQKVILVSVYPNPVSSTMTVANSESKTLSLRLIDFTGKELYSNVSSEKAISIDMRNLASGMYLLKVKHNEVEQTIKVMRD